jgi:hypothetical protein
MKAFLRDVAQRWDLVRLFMTSVGGIGITVVGIWGLVQIATGQFHPEVDWAEFLENPPRRGWVRIVDAPVVEGRSVHVVAHDGVDARTYIPLVEDPETACGTVRAFLEVAAERPTAKAAEASPVVATESVGGRVTPIDYFTAATLADECGLVSPRTVCLRVEPPHSKWRVAWILGVGGLLSFSSVRNFRALRRAKLRS